jgi:hypothetical protein
MNFTVVWTIPALDELARLYNAGPDRAAITAMSNRIDYLLARDPENVGESRAGQTRILIEPPLAVLFEVSLPDCLVTVFAVWRWSP